MNIIKRDGSIVEFNIDKIQSAIKKANREVSSEKEDMSNNDIIGLAEQVSHTIQALEDKEVDVETIQNIVEEVLMYNGYYNTAKRYILYRKEREENRLHGWQMSELQKDIYNQKYRKGSENFDDFLNRVTDGNGIIKKAMRDKKFMPAGRILAGRGLEKEGKKITFSNCYVMPQVEDNIESIFDTAKYLARTFSYGGGVGLNISKLRPRGASVNNAAGTTTGAVSFMDLYSLVTGLIGQSGRRGR